MFTEQVFDTSRTKNYTVMSISWPETGLYLHIVTKNLVMLVLKQAYNFSNYIHRYLIFIFYICQYS